MSHPIRILAVAILAAGRVSGIIAVDRQRTRDPHSGHETTSHPTMSQNIGPNGYFPSQAAARAAHPITQGGTTGAR